MQRRIGTLLIVVPIIVLGCAAQLGCTTDEHPLAPVPTASPDPANHVSKLLVFVVENRSYGQMRREMPWVDRLGRRFGRADDYHGLTHPSLPNYLAIAGGSTYGVSDDDPPAAHTASGSSVFGDAVRTGSSARLYAEAMTSPCQQESAGRYAVKHNPWAYFEDERSLCEAHDVSFDQFAGDVTAGRLPAVGMVIPDMCNDAHDCSLATADRWLRREIRRVMRAPDWTSGQLAVVVTADEDDRAHDNHILTIVAHPRLHHDVVSRRLDHYALSRSYAEVAGIAPLGEAAHAPSLLGQLGLTVG
jgi:hypothetical protein